MNHIDDTVSRDDVVGTFEAVGGKEEVSMDQMERWVANMFGDFEDDE